MLQDNEREKDQVKSSQSGENPVNELKPKVGAKKAATKAMTLNEVIAYANTQPDTEFIWSGIPRGGVGFIFGQSKSGKTILCENLGMLLAAGKEKFLGQPLLKSKIPPKVLFISLEEHLNPRANRNKKQASRLDAIHGEEWKSNYLVVDQNFPRFIATDEGWKIIDKIIKNNTPDIVFIDSLTRLVTDSIEKSRVASNLMRTLHKVANDNKITLIIIHHTTKQAGKPLAVDSMAGSRVVTQEADFAIGVNRANNKRYIKEVFFRYKAEQENSVFTFTINEYLWLEEGEKTTETEINQDADGRNDDTNPTLILEYFKLKGNKVTIPSNELEKHFLTSGKMSRKTLYDSLNKLVSTEKLSKESKGIYKLT